MNVRLRVNWPLFVLMLVGSVFVAAPGTRAAPANQDAAVWTRTGFVVNPRPSTYASPYKLTGGLETELTWAVVDPGNDWTFQFHYSVPPDRISAGQSFQLTVQGSETHTKRAGVQGFVGHYTYTGLTPNPPERAGIGIGVFVGYDSNSKETTADTFTANFTPAPNAGEEIKLFFSASNGGVGVVAWEATYRRQPAAPAPTSTPVPAAIPTAPTALTAALDCGASISVQVGTPNSPGQSTPCNLIIDGFSRDTTTSIEVIPMNTGGAEADFSGLVPSIGIVMFPGPYAEDPTNLDRPRYDPLLFSACPQTNICGADQAPTGPVSMRIVVRQLGFGPPAVVDLVLAPASSGPASGSRAAPVVLGSTGPIASRVDCGGFLTVQVGTPDSPAESSPCNLVFNGFDSTTVNPVEVLATNAAGEPAEFSGLLPGTGIVVFPGTYAEDPTILQRPRTDPLLFAACPQAYICGADQAPSIPTLIHILVRQQGAGQGQADLTISPVSAAHPPAGALTAGSSGPDTIGCIGCDGRFRFLGPGGNRVVLGPVPPAPVAGNAAEGSVAVMTTAGTMRNLRVFASASDGGIWSFTVWVNGAPSGMSCTLDPTKRPGQTACDTGSATVQVNNGDRVSLAVGNPGNPVTAGQFSVTWSIEVGP